MLSGGQLGGRCRTSFGMIVDLLRLLHESWSMTEFRILLLIEEVVGMKEEEVRNVRIEFVFSEGS